MEEIRNKVVESGLITIDLEHYLPSGDIQAFDLKDFLFMEMLLKEKDFRQALESHDWKQYQEKNHCRLLFYRCNYSNVGLYVGCSKAFSMCLINTIWNSRRGF